MHMLDFLTHPGATLAGYEVSEETAPFLPTSPHPSPPHYSLFSNPLPSTLLIKEAICALGRRLLCPASQKQQAATALRDSWHDD